MIDLLMQVIITLCLVLGIITGEALSIKAFGVTNKWYLNLIDVFLFIILLIALLNLIYLKEMNYFLIIGINFFAGLGTILLTKGITTGFGFLSKKVIKKARSMNKTTKDVLIAGLLRNLQDNGLETNEINSILINSGFSKRKVNYFSKNFFNKKKEP